MSSRTLQLPSADLLLKVFSDPDRRSSLLPVLERCPRCRSATGCGHCPACLAKAGSEALARASACHNLPPCSACGAVQLVPLSRIVRHRFHEALWQDAPERELLHTSFGQRLVCSIARIGLIEPLLVVEENGSDRLAVISGWRRYLALRVLQHEQAPVRLVHPSAIASDDDLYLLMLEANVQRVVSLQEVAREQQTWLELLSRGLKHGQVTAAQQEMARVLGVSPRTVLSRVQALTAARVADAGGRADEERLQKIADLQRAIGPVDLHGREDGRRRRGGGLVSSRWDRAVHDSLHRVASPSRDSVINGPLPPALWPAEEDPGWTVLASSEAYQDEMAGAPAAQSTGTAIALVDNLELHILPPYETPYRGAPWADLVIAAPSWLEAVTRTHHPPVVQPLPADWRQRLQRCLAVWSGAVHPGGRLVLTIPLSSVTVPDLPVLNAVLTDLPAAGWVTGAVIAIIDPNLEAPLGRAAASGQLHPGGSPVRLALVAAPAPPGAATPAERLAAWSQPLPGSREQRPGDQDLLHQVWEYRGVGPKSRHVPDFEHGYSWHLCRALARPGATVWLPELGSASFVRGCLRAGVRVVAQTNSPEHGAEIVHSLATRPEPHC